MASLKQLARIKKIYDLRAQNAERIAVERAAAREGLENEQAATRLRLQEEVEACDSLARAPFDYAARYYRASLKRIASQDVAIDEARDHEAEARTELQKRYIEKKEFEVYYDRKSKTHKEEQKLKRDSQARDIAPNAESNDYAIVDKDWAAE